jgi:hypothetical protein
MELRYAEGASAGYGLVDDDGYVELLHDGDVLCVTLEHGRLMGRVARIGGEVGVLRRDDVFTPLASLAALARMGNARVHRVPTAHVPLVCAGRLRVAEEV